MKRTVRTAIIAIMMLSVCSLGQPNLIVNGDFEAPLVGFPPGLEDPTINWDSFLPPDVPGWIVELSPEIAGDLEVGPYGQVLEIWNLNMGPAASGEQYVELDSYDPTKISQAVSTIPGALYELSYAWRPRLGVDCQMKVWIDGLELAHYTALGVEGSPWTHVTSTLTATSSSTTIAFAEVGSDDQMGMLLDAVSFVLVESPAGIDIKPETLNLMSKGKCTAFIDLPEGLDEEDIDTNTIECEGAPAVNAVMADDGRLVVKFNREDLVGVSTGDAVELTVTGQLTNGTAFTGSDTIRVISKGGKK